MIRFLGNRIHGGFCRPLVVQNTSRFKHFTNQFFGVRRTGDVYSRSLCSSIDQRATNNTESHSQKNSHRNYYYQPRKKPYIQRSEFGKRLKTNEHITNSDSTVKLHDAIMNNYGCLDPVSIALGLRQCIVLLRAKGSSCQLDVSHIVTFLENCMMDFLCEFRPREICLCLSSFVALKHQPSLDLLLAIDKATCDKVYLGRDVAKIFWAFERLQFSPSNRLYEVVFDTMIKTELKTYDPRCISEFLVSSISMGVIVPIEVLQLMERVMKDNSETLVAGNMADFMWCLVKLDYYPSQELFDYSIRMFSEGVGRLRPRNISRLLWALRAEELDFEFIERIKNRFNYLVKRKAVSMTDFTSVMQRFSERKVDYSRIKER